MGYSQVVTHSSTNPAQLRCSNGNGFFFSFFSFSRRLGELFIYNEEDFWISFFTLLILVLLRYSYLFTYWLVFRRWKWVYCVPLLQMLRRCTICRETGAEFVWAWYWYWIGWYRDLTWDSILAAKFASGSIVVVWTLWDTADLKIAHLAILNVQFTRSVLGVVRGSFLWGSFPRIFTSSVSGSIESVILFMKSCTCPQKVSSSGHLTTACSICPVLHTCGIGGIRTRPFCTVRGLWVVLCGLFSNLCLLAFWWLEGSRVSSIVYRWRAVRAVGCFSNRPPLG